MEDVIMKFKSLFLTLLFLSGFGIASLKAQEWSAAQKEVWKNVNDYWALIAKGDLNGFFEYMHTDYVGWDNGSILPSNKEESKKMFAYFYSGMKIPLYEIKPLAIKIYGDFAFVHYTYVMFMVDPDGKKKSEKGTWTDILAKQGSKWVMIGDHGGATE
jgi:ketosteroid isomerase-like protein